MEKVIKALNNCLNCKINKMKPRGKACVECKPELFDELEAELKAAKEALEKQTAKKAHAENFLYYCSECMGLVRYNQHYCNRCGKKLDWSIEK